MLVVITLDLPLTTFYNSGNWNFQYTTAAEFKSTFYFDRLFTDLPNLISMQLGSRTFQNVVTLIIDSNYVLIDLIFRYA